MASGLLFTSSIFVFSFCIGYGDGRWKKKDKGGLYQDIDVFKRLAEKIEREMEAFYEDYPEEPIEQNDIEKMQQDNINKLLGHKTGTRNLIEEEATTQKFAFTSSIINEIAEKSKSAVIQSVPTYVTFRNNDSSTSSPNWPKFEDILLEIGKRYDWKNDRWIKVKQKSKVTRKVLNDKDVSFHEKRKFSYRSVKLNRKSRRNIVIAVTAVR
ncbi:hypothetical protein O0L34_g4992 [Tuta absoluta]|nr:hypothetical protein O0L34_g4992 [Tuta absoluta]